MTLVARVFAQLADGEFHSGEDLAKSLGVTRSAVWKAATSLRDLGMQMEAVRNRGYKLQYASEPLVEQSIRQHFVPEISQRVRRLDVAWTLASTNTELVERPYPAIGESEVQLAEFQTAGRGRRGRSWLAPPGGAVCLSFSWTFPEMPRDAGSLSLAIGVCVLRALRAHGVKDIRLKWPNDVLIGDKKLGGILIELRAESAGPACVVVGIGLNVALGGEVLEKIAATGLKAVDLASVLDKPVSRNALAAALIGEGIRGLLEFERQGLKPFLEEWGDADALRGREVAVHSANDVVRGVARGVELTGALLVESPTGLMKFFSGEVTVRPADT